MKYIRLMPILLVAGLVLFLGSCAKPPQEEMDSAAAAVTRAENDPDAAAYAADSIARAKNVLERMRTEAENKRYDNAKTLAAEAISAAEKALSDGRAAAARGKQDITNLITDVKAALEETGGALSAAKEAKELALDFEILDQEFNAARRSVEQAEVAAAGGRDTEAREKGQTARSALSGIRTALSDGARMATRKQ